MQPIGDNSANIDARYRVLLILWIAMLMSVGFLFALTLLIPKPQSSQTDTTAISWALLIVGMIPPIISIFSKRQMLNKAIEKQEAPLVNTAYIIAFALCESVGVFALLSFMLAAGRAYIFMFVVSAVSLLAHYPRRTHLLAASYKTL